jgi:hypothetical protein
MSVIALRRTSLNSRVRQADVCAMAMSMGMAMAMPEGGSG